MLHSSHTVRDILHYGEEFRHAILRTYVNKRIHPKWNYWKNIKDNLMDTNLRAEIDRLHAQVCNGLADPNRIFILYTLADNAYNVSDLAKAIELPQSTVSRHLKILRDRGMVIAQRDGQSVFYSLTDERIIQALDLLRAMLASSLESQGQLARSVNQNT